MGNESATEWKAEWENNPGIRFSSDTYGRVAFLICRRNFRHGRAQYVRDNVRIAMEYFRGNVFWAKLAEASFQVRRHPDTNIDYHHEGDSVAGIKAIVLSFVGKNAAATENTPAVDIYVSFDSHPRALAVTNVPGLPDAENISISKQKVGYGQAGSPANIAHEFMHVINYYDEGGYESLPYAVSNAIDSLIKLGIAPDA